MPSRDCNAPMPASPVSSCSWLKPLRMSDAHALTSLTTVLRASASAAKSYAADRADANRDPADDNRPCATPPEHVSSKPHIHSSVGNSDNPRGRQHMPHLQIARDDEREIRCVSPQRLVSASSRVLPFAPVVVELSTADRLSRLADLDPEGFAMIARIINGLYAHHAAQR
jgi:hypothetical protein